MLVLNRSQSDLLEGCLHALSVLGTGGQVLDLRVLGQEVLDRRFLDLSLLLAIDLVPDEDEWELLGFLGCALIEELSDPGLDVIEGLPNPILTRLLVIS